jgi:hypothetical protein
MRAPEGRDRNATSGRMMRTRRDNVDGIDATSPIPTISSPRSDLTMKLSTKKSKMTAGIAAISNEHDLHIHLSTAVGKSAFHAAQ